MLEPRCFQPRNVRPKLTPVGGKARQRRERAHGAFRIGIDRHSRFSEHITRAAHRAAPHEHGDHGLLAFSRKVGDQSALARAAVAEEVFT